MKLYSLALLATVAVAQTPAPKPTDFPKVVSAQLILDSTEATQPGNEWIKPCGPANHDDACFDPAPKLAPRVADTAGYCLCLTRGCKVPTSDTKAACKRDGGNWITSTVISGTSIQKPAPLTYTPLNMNSTVVSGDIHVDNNVPGSVYVQSQTGRVVKLSDDEYARLQKLRQAVADEEKKIAAAHGVDFGQVYIPPPCIAYDMGCMEWDKTKEVQARPADHYEFRGQWLLINVPSSAKEGK